MKFIGKPRQHGNIAHSIAGVLQITYCHLIASFLLICSRSDTKIIFEYPRLERYVKTIMQHFDGDKCILAWDLYNAPGNGDAGDHETTGQYQGIRSLNLLKAVFDWALSSAVSQPSTVGVWSWEPEMNELNRIALEYSEVVSFHCYLPPEAHKERMDLMRYLANGNIMLINMQQVKKLLQEFKAIVP